jgi:cysteine desulfurase
VLNTARSLDPDCMILPVDGVGLVDPQVELPEGLGVLSVMQVNNEIGTIQPVAALNERARAMGALVVCDAVQAAGKMQVADADLIAITGHKFCGPKGIGALWIRDGVELEPIITGGGQEAGTRSGTLSPALCAGLGAAARLALESMAEDEVRVAELFDLGRKVFDGWELNGSATHRYRGNLNIRRKDVDATRLMSDVRDVMFSAGSACASESRKPSRILAAIGLTPEESRGSIRLGFGRYTTLDEFEKGAGLILEAARRQG